MKRQWKGFVSGIMVTLLLVGLIGTAVAAGYQKQATLDYTGIKITLDGKEITPTDANGAAVEPFAISGTTVCNQRNYVLAGPRRGERFWLGSRMGSGHINGYA